MAAATLVGHEPADVIALAEAVEHEDLRVARSALAMSSGGTTSPTSWGSCCTMRCWPDGAGRWSARPGRGIHGCFRVYVDEIASRSDPGVDTRLAWTVRAELHDRFCDDVRHAVRALGDPA